MALIDVYQPGLRKTSLFEFDLAYYFGKTHGYETLVFEAQGKSSRARFHAMKVQCSLMRCWFDTPSSGGNLPRRIHGAAHIPPRLWGRSAKFV